MILKIFMTTMIMTTTMTAVVVLAVGVVVKIILEKMSFLITMTAVAAEFSDCVLLTM